GFSLCANTLDIRSILSGEPVEIDQLAVAMNGRQPVSELVCDAGGQLSDRGQTLLQPKLFLELRHRGEISEEAHRAVELASRIEQGRNGYAQMRRRSRFWQRHGATKHRLASRQALVDQPGERRLTEQSSIVVTGIGLL